MKTSKIICLFLAVVLVQAVAPVCSAQSQTDWVIKDFESTITVNKDSSLLIEEKITADAGNLPDKHGIFRVLPTQVYAGDQTFKTPAKLVGITDFNNKNLGYSTISDRLEHTVTWKIGDPDVTVSGLNYYKITYLVKNAIRTGNPDFDELYWNLSGTFWQIPIEKFSAIINFPGSINSNNSQVDYYTGYNTEKGKDLANYKWTGASSVEFDSTGQLGAGQGITASITFPKNIIAPYRPGFLELYGAYLWLLIPIFAFILCFWLWFKYGRDPRVDKTIIPEFEIPENLTPLEMGMLYTDGKFDPKFITATIVDLAVRKILSIEETQKTWIMGKNDFKIKKIPGAGVPLAKHETELVNGLFEQGDEVLVSSLKNNFYRHVAGIKKAVNDVLVQKKLEDPSGLKIRGYMTAAAAVCFFSVFFALHDNFFELSGSLAISAAVLAIFAAIMPRRTPAGAELNWRIKGFKLYMETAEKYRAQFNEKENIFEKFLPYAIMFGMAKLWAKKMEEIYGKDYFTNYHPIWYVGGIGSFNADSFTSNLNSLSSSIASNAGTSSGAAGGGFSGGGGGGGGGGGW